MVNNLVDGNEKQQKLAALTDLLKLFSEGQRINIAQIIENKTLPYDTKTEELQEIKVKENKTYFSQIKPTKFEIEVPQPEQVVKRKKIIDRNIVRKFAFATKVGNHMKNNQDAYLLHAHLC